MAQIPYHAMNAAIREAIEAMNKHRLDGMVIDPVKFAEQLIGGNMQDWQKDILRAMVNNIPDAAPQFTRMSAASVNTKYEKTIELVKHTPDGPYELP